MPGVLGHLASTGAPLAGAAGTVLGRRMALGALEVCPCSAHWDILLSDLSLEPRRPELAEAEQTKAARDTFLEEQ